MLTWCHLISTGCKHVQELCRFFTLSELTLLRFEYPALGPHHERCRIAGRLPIGIHVVF